MKKFLAKYIASPLRRFRKAERGVTAIEFAFVAPVFLMVTGVMLESGFMLFTEYVLQTSVQKAAREMKTGRAQSGGVTAAGFKDKICGAGSLGGIVIDCSKVTVYARNATSLGTLRSNMPSFLNVGNSFGGPPNPSNYSCGKALDAVGVVATYDWTFKIPYFMYPLGNVNMGTSSMFGISVSGANQRRLFGLAVFRNEPFPSSWANCPA
jgi:Flp pilus assembly protein TadG